MIAGGFVLVALLIGAIFAFRIWMNMEDKPENTADTCLPAEVDQVLANTGATVRNPGNLNVYFDASGGMAGYTSRSPNVIGNLGSLARNFVGSSLYAKGKPGKVQFRRFGTYRFDAKAPQAPALIEDPRTFARPAVYTDPDTNIADLLRWVAYDRSRVSNPAARPLSVVVTDFMLDDTEAIDDFEASVGGVLRSMVIEDGLAVGILAVRVPFEGNIYVQNQTFKVAVRDRPLVMLLIGDPYQVRSFYEYLETSEISPFSARTAVSDRALSLFGLEAGSIVLADPEVSGLSTGFANRQLRDRLPGVSELTSFRFDAGSAKSDAEGGIDITLQANAGVKDYEVVGNEPLWSSAIWKLDDPSGCAAGTAWQRIGRLSRAGWKQTGQSISYRLDAAAMADAGMDREGVYLVQLLAGQRGLVEDHPAAAWMSEWSMSNAQMAGRLAGGTRVGRLGVPGLEPLRKVLLTELMMPGREAMKRSASQLIIQTE